MNPQVFLAEFPKHRSLNQNDPCQMFSQHLDGMLRRIGIDDPRSGTATELGQIAETVIEHDRESQERQNNSWHRSMGKRTSGKIVARKYNDETLELSSEELEAKVVEGTKKLRLRLNYVSALMLASTVALSPKMEFQSSIDQSMGNNCMRLADVLAQSAYQINVQRYFLGNSQSGKTNIDITSMSTFRLPNWMRNVHGWDDGPVDELTGSHVETDAVVSFFEWCRKLKEGYLPLFAPPNIDSGQYSLSREISNLQSDILLCRLTPGEEAIIPTQVKTSATDKDGLLYVYDKRVMVVTAQHLGLVSTCTESIKIGDHTHTGSKTTLQAGKHTRNWTAALLSKQNRKQRYNTYVKSINGVLSDIDLLVAQKLAEYQLSSSE